MDKWLNGQIAKIHFSRKQLPKVFWPKIIGYLISAALLITAFFGLYLKLFPESGQLALLNSRILVNPFNKEAHLALGKYYAESGNLKKAKKELEIAYSLGSQEAVNVYKEALSIPANIKKEIAFWEEQVKSKPDYRDAYIKLSSLYYQLQEFDKAKENLEKARQIDPNYPEVRQLEILLK
jgi:tetratricopeptide (TPR) repeat protein